MQPINTTSYVGGALGVAISDSGTIRARLNTLTTQAADGRIADSFAGLGAGAATSLALTPAIATNANWQKGIDAATGRMNVAQTALASISSIASSFYAQSNNLNGLNDQQVQTIASSARDALRQMAGLLDTTDAGTYVFAGQDSANPPVPDPDQIATSGFATSIAAAVGGLAANGASATIAATVATASSNAPATSPFSTALSQAATAVNVLRPSVTVGQSSSVATGIMASANADVVSTGANSTGSYMRDIMRGLATLAALTPGQSSVAGFSDLVADTRATLGSAVDALNEDAGVMGNRQAALATSKTLLATTATALQAQASSAQDVDMAATLSELTKTQTQLQASYQLIAGLQSLSLTKYITA